MQGKNIAGNDKPAKAGRPIFDWARTSAYEVFRILWERRSGVGELT
jgi:hypothetical protein